MTVGFPLRREDRLAPPHRDHHIASTRTLGFVVLAAILAGAVPLLLVVDVPDVGRSTGWVLTLAIAVWGGIRLSYAIIRGDAQLFDFFFWLFAYIFMGLAPTVQMRSGLLSTTTPGMNPDLDVPIATVVWIGLLCYELGRVIAVLRERSLRHARARAAGGTGGTAGAVAGPLAAGAPERPITGIHRGRTLILLAAGVLFAAYFVQKIGVGTLLSSRDTAFAARQAAWTDPATRSVMYALSIYPLLVGIGAMAVLRRATTTHRRLYLAIILGAAVLLLIVVNPVSSARYSMGTVWFALIVYAGAMLTRRRRRLVMIGAIAGLIFVFPLADAFRRTTVDVSWDGFFGEYKGSPDYDAFWQIGNAYSYVHDGLVVPGQQALGMLFFWVPRAIWANKPIDTGILLANYRGYPFSNLSAPLWAESMVNGGLIVVIAVFIVAGFALRRFDTRLIPAFAENGLWAIVGAIFPVYMLILLRGSLLQASGTVAIAIACILFVARRGERPVSGSRAGRRLAERLPPARPSLAGRSPAGPPRSPASRTAHEPPAGHGGPAPRAAEDPPAGGASPQ